MLSKVPKLGLSCMLLAEYTAGGACVENALTFASCVIDDDGVYLYVGAVCHP